MLANSSNAGISQLKAADFRLSPAVLLEANWLGECSFWFKTAFGIKKPIHLLPLFVLDFM
jgi:hypothetical protein